MCETEQMCIGLPPRNWRVIKAMKGVNKENHDEVLGTPTHSLISLGRSLSHTHSLRVLSEVTDSFAGGGC